MLTRDQAKAIVERQLSWISEAVVVIDSQIIERPFGWVFFYQSQRYLQTGEVMDQLAGNAPLIVNRFNGEVFVNQSDFRES